jgi:cell division protein FtsQ
MKKFIKHIALTIAVLGYMIVILGFVSREEKKITFSRVRIIIHDSLDIQFVNSRMIRNVLLRGSNSLTGRSFDDINLQETEDRIKEIKYIKRAEVYTTVAGELVLDIYQRKPEMRIIDRSGQGFYIDREGYVIPLSPNYSPYVMVVNGTIGERYRRVTNIYELDPENNILADIYKLVKFIQSDRFWDAQIVQIYVNGKGEFELIPRVGAHVIEFGKADNIEEKFEKLWILYSEGFYNKGWNQYDRINLKYNNQAICTKR